MEHSPGQQDYREEGTLGFAPYRNEDEGGADPTSPLPDYTNHQASKPLPPRFQKQQQVSRPADATARSLKPLIPLPNSCLD